MDNKLSELSKPTAFVVTGGTLYQDRAFTDKSTAERSKADRHDGAVIEPLYSQEYVSALLAELERYKQYAKERDAENESLALTVGRLRVELEAKDKRIAELEAIRSAAEKLVRCKGRYHSEQNYRALAALFGVTTPDLPPVEGDSEAVIAELRAKLATPVRLPGSFYPDGDIDLPLVVELDEAVEAIRAAGFTVEGG